MTLRIEVGELGLSAMDALRVSALAVLVGPDRPLQGLAGLADWRLCGALSRAITSGHFVPGSGEALLLPSGGRIFPPRVFCFGLPEGMGPEGPTAAVRRVLDALARARCPSFAASLPAGAGSPWPRLWLEESLRHPEAAQVLLGEARALTRELEAARLALLADADVVAFRAREEVGRPGAATAVVLPRGSPVVP